MEYFEDYDDLENLPTIRNMPPVRPYRPEKVGRKEKKRFERNQLVEQQDEIREYEFTYKASRHERTWILDSLGMFHAMQWFSDVLECFAIPFFSRKSLNPRDRWNKPFADAWLW